MSEVSKILDGMLSSEVKGDLLSLFHKNPGLIDTVDGVARRIGRTPDAIKADLEDLVELGLLKTKRIRKSEVILLDRARDKQLRAAIDVYLKDLKKGKGV